MKPKKQIIDPESWDYRECASCGRRTTLGAIAERQCKKCGSAAMIKKHTNLEEVETRKRRRTSRGAKSAAGQTLMFDKHANAAEET